MKNKPAGKILSFVIAAALILGGVAATPITARAADIEVGTASALLSPVDNGGTTTYQYVYFGEYSGSPIKWRVLVADSGVALLLTEDLLNVQSDCDNNMQYTSSTQRTWLTGTGASDFPQGFTDAEKDAVKPQNVINEYYGNQTAQDDTGGDLFYLLSADEANNATYFPKGNNDRAVTGTYWWLRSLGDPLRNYSAFVHDDGGVNDSGHYNGSFGFRPAFKLDLSSVILTSEISNGKAASVGASLSAAEPPTENLKLTVVDSDNSNVLLTVANQTAKTAAQGGSVTIAYTGAKTGENKYVSCVITNTSGEVKYYGKLAQAADYDAVINIPADMPTGSYTIRLFNEICNSDSATDYCSDPIDIGLTVELPDTTAPTLTAGTVNRASDTAATVKFTSNEAGQYYYEVVANGAGDPNINTSNAGTACGATEVTITLTTLTAGAQDIWIYVKDAAGNVGKLKIDIPAYVAPPSNTYYLTVVNGTDNTGGSPYTAATQVSITADAAPSGQAFDYWSSDNGGSFVDAGSASTIFNMPAANVIVTAHYKNAGGSYTGGDSSNYTPPVIWNITTDKQPNLPKTATLAHSGTVTNSRLTATITKAMVQAALDKAGTDPDGIGLIFDITGGGFTAQTITFEAGAIYLLKSSSVKFVQVNTGMFRFKFDDKAISQLDAQTVGPVSVNANPAKLNEAAKRLIGSRPAFDVTVQFKKDGKTWNVVSFGSGKMTRWIAYKPAAGESTGNLAAVYVDKNGKASWIDDSAYDNGWLGWTGSTCSVYGVGYKAPAPAFIDTASHWANDNIDFAVSRGYMSGTSDTTFSPNTIITRGMFITALGRLSDVDVSGYDVSSFSDVSGDSYYLPYIEWAVENKIVQGVGGGRFAPENPIAREDMAVMMTNFAKAMNYKLPIALEAFKFTDAGSIAAHAKDAVATVQQAGIVVGKSGGVFDPKGNLTRAEACTVLRRFVETVIDPASARGWAKNDSGQWMYYGLTSGKLVTGWQDIGGGRYYFDTNGAMQAEKWVQIEGKRYYFYPDGKLAVNTKIDGYEVGADGARK